MADLVSIVNTIRANGGTEMSLIPEATRNNIAAVANPILEYESVRNAFMQALVNKIAFTVIQNKAFTNPLEIFKKGKKELGYDIESIYVNPATGQAYSAGGSSLMTAVTPDVKAEYFRLNRQDKFPATVYRNQLRHAFTSWENLEKLVDGIIQSIYNGDYISEYILMKNTLADAVLMQKMRTAPITAVTDDATGKAFVKAIKNLGSAFTFPSSSWNAYAKAGGTGTAITTWTPKEEQVLVVCSDILNNVSVDVLAAAFNLGKVDFMGRVVEVDNFGKMTGVQAILMDEETMQVWDDMTEMGTFYNSDGLFTNYFWHHWQTYALSLFRNAVALVTDDTADAAPAITAPGATDTEVSGTGVAGSFVFVTIGTETKSAIVAVGGAWTVTGFTAMLQGATVTAYQVDPSGNKSASDTEAVTA